MSIKQLYSSNNGSSTRTLSPGVTEYQMVNSDMKVGITSEDEVALYFRPDGGVFSNQSLFIVANTMSVDGTHRLRVEKASVNSVVTITASTTGTFTDGSNTDTISAGDRINYLYTASAGTGTATVSHTEIVFSPTTNYKVYAGMFAAGSSSAVRYLYMDDATGAGHETTESITQMVWRSAGTFKKLNTWVRTNTDVTNRNLRFRLNTANSNQVAVMTALTTGFFEDASNTDTNVSGDVISFQLDQITAAIALQTTYHSITHVPTASATTVCGGLSLQNVNDGITRYSPIGGSKSAGNSTEANVKTPVAFGWTALKLQIYVLTNAASGASTCDLRVGGASSALTFSITGSTTGEFTDLSNVVSGNSGDLLSTRVVNGGGGSLATRARGFIMQEGTPSTAYTSTLTETVTDTDTITKAESRTLTETVTDTDTIKKAPTRTLMETVVDTDTVLKAISRILTDTVTDTDTLVKGAGKVLSETGTLTASLVKDISRALTETGTVTDTLIKAVARVLVETCTETDTVIKGAGKVLLETGSLTDATVLKDIARILTETVTDIDTHVELSGHGFVGSETVTVTDSLVITLALLVSKHAKVIHQQNNANVIKSTNNPNTVKE